MYGFFPVTCQWYKKLHLFLLSSRSCSCEGWTGRRRPLWAPPHMIIISSPSASSGLWIRSLMVNARTGGQQQQEASIYKEEEEHHGRDGDLQHVQGMPPETDISAEETGGGGEGNSLRVGKRVSTHTKHGQCIRPREFYVLRRDTHCEAWKRRAHRPRRRGRKPPSLSLLLPPTLRECCVCRRERACVCVKVFPPGD